MLKEDEILRDVAVRLGEVVALLAELPEEADLSGRVWTALKNIRDAEEWLRHFSS